MNEILAFIQQHRDKIDRDEVIARTGISRETIKKVISGDRTNIAVIEAIIETLEEYCYNEKTSSNYNVNLAKAKRQERIKKASILKNKINSIKQKFML